MTPNKNPNSDRRSLHLVRRVALLTSVAAIGLTVLAAGPGGYRPFHTATFTSSAFAAESMQQPSGFADLVAKVKPSVISVRVTMDRPARTAQINDGDDNATPRKGPPMQRFFGQEPNMPNGKPQDR